MMRSQTSDNVQLLLDSLPIQSENLENAVVVLLDMEKAFDMVRIKFLEHVIEKMIFLVLFLG